MIERMGEITNTLHKVNVSLDERSDEHDKMMKEHGLQMEILQKRYFNEEGK